MRVFSFVAGWLVLVFGSGSACALEASYSHRVLQLQGGAEAHVVVFDRKHSTLKVVKLSPGTTVAKAAQANGGLAGVNGGYFQPNREPLGLVVSQGVQVHPMESFKILTGVLVVTPKSAVLLRNAEFKPGRNVREALQAGPFLVDHGKAVSGRNAKRRAERTVLLADRDGVVAFLTTSPVTLAELAQILAEPDVLPGQKLDRALNLDGGSSTALWVADEPVPYSHPEWKAVQNAVVLVPRGR